MTIYWGDGTSQASGIEYAAGTWTPTPNWGSGHSGATGKYVRVGGVCHAWGYINQIDDGSSDPMRINGLPYNADGSQNCGNAMTQYNGDADQNLSNWISDNTNYFNVFKSDSGSWSALTYHDQGGSNKWYWQLSYKI